VPLVNGPNDERPLVLYGATGHALSVRAQIERVFASRNHRIVAYIDDFAAGGAVAGVPVIGFEEWRARFRDVPVIVTIGEPGARRTLAERIVAAGGVFASMCGDWPSIAADFTYGEGSFTGGPNYIGPNVTIGRHVQIQPMTTLAHDARVGDYTTICTSNIAGWVLIEDEVFIGVGAAIVNGTSSRPIRIGQGAVIYAGAVVTKSVPAGMRVAGNPARDVSLAAARRRRAAHQVEAIDP
jgi:sugar O-acyltransferase (sialic acid O-acetyltransferase NeuD family)